MASEFDLKHICCMKDLKKLKEAGASAEEIRRAHAKLCKNNKQSKKATKKFLNLNWSCIAFSLHQIKKLAEQGANLNVKNKQGDTLLHEVCSCIPCSAKEVKFLVKCGADVNVRDKKGNTPLLLVSGYNSVKILRFLVAHGAQMNAKNRCGRTPLHESVRCHPDLAGYLALQGADPHVKDIRGRTAFDMVPDYNSVVILKNAYEARQEEVRSGTTRHGLSLLSVLAGWCKAHQRSE